MSSRNDDGVQQLPPLELPPIVDTPAVVMAAPAPAAELAKPTPKTEKPAPVQAREENALITLFGWIARFVVGVFFISSIFPLSLITSVAAFGWLQRRMQAFALRGWWKESPRRMEGSFAQFCDTLGLDAPVERPRWFVRERVLATLDNLAKGNTFISYLGFVWTLVTVPVHSLFLNFKVGIAGLFTTYLLTGWGCSIMLFSWYFGWLNSFHKGYEDAFLGLLSGLFGSFLLILALIYVPMAQVHQAAAGEIMAFFQFRVVMKLILTRLTGYLFLVMALAFTSLVFEIPRLLTLGEGFVANDPDISARQAFWILEGYWFFCSIFFFLSLLILRTFAALIYRSAMLKAVRAGTILVSDLPPTLAFWFEKLEIVPQLQAPQPVLLTMARKLVGWNYRAFLISLVFLFWMLFVMRFYVGYFFVFNEARGILNHPVVQCPTIDWTPWHLVAGRDE